jgi:hypothetical protein
MSQHQRHCKHVGGADACLMQHGSRIGAHVATCQPDVTGRPVSCMTCVLASQCCTAHSCHAQSLHLQDVTLPSFSGGSCCCCCCCRCEVKAQHLLACLHATYWHACDGCLRYSCPRHAALEYQTETRLSRWICNTANQPHQQCSMQAPGIHLIPSYAALELSLQNQAVRTR